MLPSLDTEVKDSTDYATGPSVPIVSSALNAQFEAPSDRGRYLQTMAVPVRWGRSIRQYGTAIGADVKVRDSFSSVSFGTLALASTTRWAR